MSSYAGTSASWGRPADLRGLAATLFLDGMRGVGIRAKCTSTNERYASIQPGEELAHALAGGGFLQRMNDRVSQHVFRELRLREIGRALQGRSEEQTSELQSLMSISYAIFCLKKN